MVRLRAATNESIEAISGLLLVADRAHWIPLASFGNKKCCHLADTPPSHANEKDKTVASGHPSRVDSAGLVMTFELTLFLLSLFLFQVCSPSLDGPFNVDRFLFDRLSIDRLGGQICPVAAGQICPVVRDRFVFVTVTPR